MSNISSFFNPNSGIVRDSLRLHYDFSLSQCYSGSGSSITDLSGSQAPGTLYNSPTFDNTNGGALVFNGVSQHARTPLNLTTANAVTLEVWLKPSNATIAMAVEHSVNASNIGGLGGFFLATNTDGFSSVASLVNTAYRTNAGIFRNINFTCGTTNYSCHVNTFSKLASPTGRLEYANGVLTPFAAGTWPTGTDTVAGPNFRNDTMFIATRGGASLFFAGRIAIIRVYAKALSDQEVAQNFEANRGRFKL